MNDRRAQDLTQFYELLAQLERKVGGARRLSKCNGKMGWPRSGVYFFREAGESRSDAGVGQRIVRVGTHTSHNGNGSLLWRRLRMHRGNAKDGGGNHRGSVFREIVGAALIAKYGYSSYPKWSQGSSASKELRESERPLEQEVSAVIGDMPFLWLRTEDEPWPNSLRKYIERNAIGLLSSYQREEIDPPSDVWLGHCSDREKVRQSGLWNSDHADKCHDPAFLDCLERLIERM